MEEVEEFIGAADALAINVGTLEPMWVAAMKLAAKRCVELGKPWVLDPVAAGKFHPTMQHITYLTCFA